MPTLFISYKRDDKVAVTKISDRLKKEFYFDIWIDSDSIPGGKNWQEAIQRGIDEADVVLLMLTPDACASVQVKEEVDYAKKIDCKIVPLQIKKVTEDEQRKLGIQNIQHIDFVGIPDERSAWERLLDALPPVLGRNKRQLDPNFLKLHQAYLRTLFVRYGTVNLSQLTHSIPPRSVKLMDIYVDLFLGFRLYGQIRDNQLVDWEVEKSDEDDLTPQSHYELNAKPNLRVVTSYRTEQSANDKQAGDLPEESLKGAKKLLGLEETTEMLTGRAQLYEKLQSKVSKAKFNDGKHELWRIESEQAAVLNSHLIIIGEVGSGKSTLMRYLALCLAGDMLPDGEEVQASRNRLSFWPLPAFTPVFIELKMLVQTTFSDVKSQVTLENFFTYLRDELLKPNELSSYFDDLRDQMRDGAVMFFLDALDEITDIENLERREQIKLLVALLRGSFPSCRILITSRPYAYAGDWQLEGFGQVQIAALDTDRLRELAVKLFQVELGIEEAEQEAATFTNDIQAKVSDELRRNPMLFTLLAALWLNNRTLPSNQRLPVKKSAIFRECIKMLINHWTQKDIEKGKSLVEFIGLTEIQIFNLLETLAFVIHSKGDLFFESGLIMTVLRRDMKMTKGEINHDLLLEALKNRAEIIYERNIEQFQFSYLSFQEFLAASYLARPNHYPNKVINLIVEQPQLWRNVLALLIDQADDKKLNLWEMLKELLPAKDSFHSREPDNKYWEVIYYFGDLLFNHLPTDDDLQQIYRPRLKNALLEIIKLGALSPIDRATCGRWLSELGDTRKGVGLNNAGLPDIDWVEIPEGRFLYFVNEHNIYLRLPAFKIARYPVTYSQFQAFVVDPDGYNNPEWWAGLSIRSQLDTTLADQIIRFANHPRENVNWYQSIAFCRWLSARLGYGISLPTEQQWQKAARGTRGFRYAYGNVFDSTKANTFITGIGQTSAVGLFPDGCSPYGVADMGGNICEWCLNKFDDENDVSVNGTYTRTISGFSWSDDNSNEEFYIYYHGREYPAYWSSSWGFRIICR